MIFVPAGDDEVANAAVQELDDMVQHLAHQDVMGRRAASEGDIELAGQVSMAVGTALSGVTWGMTPTVIMHLVSHVNMARQDAGRLSMTCVAAADGLTKAVQVMSEAGAPVDLCATLMDLAVELRDAAEASPFVPSGCDDGEECNHD